MPRPSWTLIELLAATAIMATVVALLAPLRGPGAAATEGSNTTLLRTVRHDGHDWIVAWQITGIGGHADCFVHHPDCPCRGRPCEAP